MHSVSWQHERFPFTHRTTPRSGESSTALKAIIETGSDREAAARQSIEAAGGKLHGFYGMFGQEYGLAMIVEAPGHAEYIGGISPAISSGVFESYKTIPLYTWAELTKSVSVRAR